MTSKEALDKLKRYCSILNCDEPPYQLFKEELEIIEKDLEVLGILKKHFYEEYKITSGPYSLLFRMNGTPEYVKVKDWLENDL